MLLISTESKSIDQSDSWILQQLQRYFLWTQPFMTYSFEYRIEYRKPLMKIIQSYFYHKDARKMRLANFLYAYDCATMQVSLDRLLGRLIPIFCEYSISAT